MELLTFITGALRNIGSIDETEAPSAEAGQAALANLNHLMAELEEDSIVLGWAPTDTLTDSFAFPAGHVRGLQAMLALKEASDRGIEPPAWVAAAAGASRDRLMGQAFSLAIERSQSNTLPCGESQRYGYDILTG